MMQICGTLLVVAGMPGLGSAHPAKADGAEYRKPPAAEIHASPEMQRLFDSFLGDWEVEESFEINASAQGKERHGTASFHAGAGPSLIEDYKSDGSAGKLSFVALLWWDRSSHVFRVLTCANRDGCAMRGTAQWDGDTLVNSWQENVEGKTATYKDSFANISTTAFRLVSEGSAGGKTIWRVITQYRRLRRRSHNGR